MGTILKKENADKLAFTHQPKAFSVETSNMARDFIKKQDETSSDFMIADVVAAQSGIQALRKKSIEAQVEGTVLERLKEIEEQAYAHAHELGMVEGREQAFQETKEEFAVRLKRMDDFLLLLDDLKSHILRENEAMFVKLIFQIASKIAVHEIKNSNDPILELLNHLVSEVQTADSIAVKMNPEDFKFIEGLREKQVKEVEKLVRVQLIANPAIDKGGCVVETNYGEIDATVQTRLDKAWATIESRLPSARKGVETT